MTKLIHRLVQTKHSTLILFGKIKRWGCWLDKKDKRRKHRHKMSKAKNRHNVAKRPSYACFHTQDIGRTRDMVGATGFEPATPCSQSRCATKLRYAPTAKRRIENARHSKMSRS